MVLGVVFNELLLEGSFNYTYCEVCYEVYYVGMNWVSKCPYHMLVWRNNFKIEELKIICGEIFWISMEFVEFNSTQCYNMCLLFRLVFLVAKFWF